MVTGHGSNTIGGGSLFRPYDRAQIKAGRTPDDRAEAPANFLAKLIPAEVQKNFDPRSLKNPSIFACQVPKRPNSLQNRHIPVAC